MQPDRVDILARAVLALGQRVLGDGYSLEDIAARSGPDPVAVTVSDLSKRIESLEASFAEVASTIAAQNLKQIEVERELREAVAALHRAAVLLDERIDSINVKTVAA